MNKSNSNSPQKEKTPPPPVPLRSHKPNYAGTPQITQQPVDYQNDLNNATVASSTTSTASTASSNRLNHSTNGSGGNNTASAVIASSPSKTVVNNPNVANYAAKIVHKTAMMGSVQSLNILPNDSSSANNHNHHQTASCIVAGKTSHSRQSSYDSIINDLQSSQLLNDNFNALNVATTTAVHSNINNLLNNHNNNVTLPPFKLLDGEEFVDGDDGELIGSV